MTKPAKKIDLRARQKEARKKMSEGGGGGPFPNLDRNMIGEIQVGTNYWRIVPWDKTFDDVPGVVLGKHFGIAEGEVLPCFDVMLAVDGACLVCRYINQKRKQMEKEEFQEWSDDIRKRTNFAVWAYDLQAPNKGLKILELPKGLGDKVDAKYRDEEGGAWWKAGQIYDFRIKKEGKGLNTKYELDITRKFADQPVPKKILGAVTDLFTVYEIGQTQEWWDAKIAKLLKGLDSGGVEEEDEGAEVEEDEEEAPAPKKKAKAPVVEEEDDVEEEVAEEEEDEPAPPPKKKAKPAPVEEEEEEEVAAEEDEEEEVVEEEEEEEPAPPPKKVTAPAKKAPVVEEDEEEEFVEDEEEEEPAPPPKKVTASAKKPAAAVEEEEEEFAEDEEEEAPPPKAAAKSAKVSAGVHAKLNAASK